MKLLLVLTFSAFSGATPDQYDFIVKMCQSRSEVLGGPVDGVHVVFENMLDTMYHVYHKIQPNLNVPISFSKGSNFSFDGASRTLVLDLSNTLLEQNDEGIFSQNVWILQENESLMSGLNKFNIGFLAEVYTVRSVDNRMEISEVYSIEAGSLTKHLIEVWNVLEEDFIVVKRALSIHRRRQDLQGLRFKVGYVHTSPYTGVGIDNEGNPYGAIPEIINAIAKELNFTYDILPSPDGKFGTADANGSWNGLIRMVMDRKIDFTLSPTVRTHSRMTVVDFTHPYHQRPYEFIIKDPVTAQSNAMLGTTTACIWHAGSNIECTSNIVHL